MTKATGRRTAAMARLRQVLDAEPLAVLATSDDGGPYCSLMAVAASADCKSLIVATERNTTKFRNLSAEPRVSLLIDDRAAAGPDLTGATAVTAVGRAEELVKSPTGRLQKRFLARHPHLKAFVASADCAIVKIRVEKYVVVDRFQRVTELQP